MGKIDKTLIDGHASPTVQALMEPVSDCPIWLPWIDEPHERKVNPGYVESHFGIIVEVTERMAMEAELRAGVTPFDQYDDALAAVAVVQYLRWMRRPADWDAGIPCLPGRPLDVRRIFGLNRPYADRSWTYNIVGPRPGGAPLWLVNLYHTDEGNCAQILGWYQSDQAHSFAIPYGSTWKIEGDRINDPAFFS